MDYFGSICRADAGLNLFSEKGDIHEVFFSRAEVQERGECCWRKR